MGQVGGRALTALLALAAIPIGLELSAVAQLVALVAVLVGMLLGEGRGRRAPGRPGSSQW